MEMRGNTLKFHQIEVEDAGRYECLARTRYDTNVTAVAEVIVNGGYTSDFFISKPMTKQANRVPRLCFSVSQQF